MSIEELYEKYFTYVYRYLVSVSRDKNLAEELTQETFFKALKRIDSFRGESSVQSWLCQIGKNCYLDHLRRQSRFSHQNQNDQKSDKKNLEENLVDKESAWEIVEKIHNIKEPYKEVLYLRIFGEVSFREIGALFSKSESWAKMTYLRARRKIREELYDGNQM